MEILTPAPVGTLSEAGLDYCKRIRRQIAAAEQRATLPLFGAEVVDYATAIDRMHAIAVAKAFSHGRIVRELKGLFDGLDRSDPQHLSHRYRERKFGSRTMNVDLMVARWSRHPVRGIEDGHCLSVLTTHLVITRQGRTVIPTPILAVSQHALGRLHERCGAYPDGASVITFAFELAGWSQALLRAGGSRHVAKELNLPLPGNAIAVGIVRVTRDGSRLRRPRLWLDVRTVLARKMCSEEQLRQAEAMDRLLGDETGDNVTALRDRVPVVDPKRDHVSRQIEQRRKRLIEEQRRGS